MDSARILRETTRSDAKQFLIGDFSLIFHIFDVKIE